MDKEQLSMEKLVFGRYNTLPITYIENSLRNGRNIAVAGRKTCKKSLFSKSILAHFPERKIYLAKGSNMESMRKVYPSRVVDGKYCADPDGIFYIDESDCSNMRHILPPMVFGSYIKGQTEQILSVHESDNNRQMLIMTTRMLQQYSMEFDWNQCSQIICRKLCEVCVEVMLQESHLVISQIWENHVDPQGRIKQKLVMVYTNDGYFMLPEDTLNSL